MPLSDRFALLAVVLVALAVAAGGAGAQAPTTLKGVVGPAFTITLTKADGSAVDHLDPGTYTIDVQDLSDQHDFHLSGPGVDQATVVSAVTNVTWTVTLRDGTYKFRCDPHEAIMSGTF